MDRLREWSGSARRWIAARPRGLTAAIVLMACALFGTTGAAAWFAYDLTAGLPTPSQVKGLEEMAQATTILDAHDRPVFTIFKEQRIEVPFERISPNLIKAVLSVEDQRFYDHSGVDFIRVAAAVLRNLHEGRRAEGGSTITQQLARQSFLTRDKTYRRKIKEVILAANIEHQYDKKDILELYLNKVYFGDGYYGVEAASLGYFGKHASELSVPEAALLAGLIQSPSSYAPTVNPDRALARRNIVLQSMVGNAVLTQPEADAAKKARLQLTNAIEMKESFGLYFKEQVRRELVDRFGGSRVAQGGLRVYTTLEPDLQQAAEKILESGIDDIESRRGYKHPRRGKDAAEYLQGALVAMDPTTGEVRAMVGGRDFGESRFNRATQAKRQSGSAFKPFVYAAALEAGYSPASLISNLNSPVLTAQGDWVPEDGHSNASELTMRSALKISSNRAAVQMLNTIGIKEAVSYAQKLNVGTPPSVPSLALGSSDVTLIALTAAYGAFADHGIVRTPLLIRKVEDSDGKVIFQDGGKSQQAVSDSTAFLMSSMLADVISAGTAYKARQAGFVLPAAGKTGTTNDYVDAWFVGYTPHLVTGVWVGFDQPKTIIANGYAADLAVPIWGQFMKVATRDAKPDWFDRPANVIGVNVCRVSGKLPNYGCSNVQTVDDSGAIEVKSMVYTDYFVKGTQPTTTCPVHTTMFGNISAGAVPSPGNLPGEHATLPAPPAQATSGSGAAPAAAPITGGTVESQQQKADQPKKKGFWRRVFGGGDKADDKKPDDKKGKDKKGPGGA